CRSVRESVRHLVEVQLHFAKRARDADHTGLGMRPACRLVGPRVRTRRLRTFHVLLDLAERMKCVAVRSIARSRQARFRHRDSLDSRGTRLTLLDCVERTGPAQAETSLAVLEGGRRLARHYLGNLARF